MTLSRTTSGVYAIAPTPFLPSGAIDFASLDTMTAFYETVGCHGLTLLGQMGEAPKMTGAEGLEIVKHVLKRTKMQIIVGVTASGFAAMKELSDAVMQAGANGVMIAPPNSLRTDDQIVTYYSQSVEAIGAKTPFVIQDYPLTFSVQMTPKVIQRIALNHENCVMLKHEDWPGLEKISTLRGFEAKGEMPRLSILCGNGGLFLDFEMARGADGAMTGYCFPDMLVDVVSLYQQGEKDQAHDLFDAHLPLIRYEQQQNVGLAVRKYIMQKRGIIAHATQRNPAGVLSEKARLEVDYLLSRLAKFDKRAQF